MAVSALNTFMESPLVLWVKTFNTTDPADFYEICDATYLIDVMLHIHPKQAQPEFNRKATDTISKLQNWRMLLKMIRTYYQDVLQQVVIMEPVDVMSIAVEPTKESSGAEMHRVLKMILGCAIQSERREEIITGIQRLDISVQEAIMQYIKEITECPENILQLDMVADLEDGITIVYSLLQRVVAQRDAQFQRLIELLQEKEYYKSELMGKAIPQSPQVRTFRLNNEVTKYKGKVRQLTEENEENLKVITDMKEELQEVKTRLKKLNIENGELRKDAEASRSCLDELDSVKEQASKVDQFKKEIMKHKEELNELGFYRVRVQELRQENSTLTEAQVRLEEQLDSLKLRADSLVDELAEVQIQMDEVNVEKDRSQQRIQELLEENATLSYQHFGTDEGVRKIRSYSSTEILAASSIKNIAQELDDTIPIRTTEAEQENALLKDKMAQYETEIADALQLINTGMLTTQITDLHQKTEGTDESYTEDSDSQLKLEIQKLLDELMTERNKRAQSDTLYQELAAEKEQSENTISVIKESSAQKIKELEIQLEAAQVKTESVEIHNNKINNLCGPQVPPEVNNAGSNKASHVQTTENGMVSHQSHSPAMQVTIASRSISSEEQQSSDASPNSSVSWNAPESKSQKQQQNSTKATTTELLLQSSHSNEINPTTTGQRLPVVLPLNFVIRGQSKGPRAGRNTESQSALERPFGAPCINGQLVYREVKCVSSSRRDKHDSLAKRNTTGVTGNKTQLLSDGNNNLQVTNSGSTVGKREHYLSSFQMVSSELGKSGTMKASERWDSLVNKIVELQNKIQELALDNSSLRKRIQTLLATKKRTEELEKKNMYLEVENRKLKKICETSKGSRAKKQYQFDSRV